MTKNWPNIDYPWGFPKSFIDRYFDESRAYIRWGYKLTFFPLLVLLPFAIFYLDRSVAIPFVIMHVSLAFVIGVLIYLTHRSTNGILVNLLTFGAYAAGGTSLNAAAFFNDNPPLMYATVGQVECLLLLFITVRSPWVLTIPYGVGVVAVFCYIVLAHWDIAIVDAITIVTALFFILFIVGLGCYARDRQAYLLYSAQDSVAELENERVQWAKVFTKFLNHELSNQIAGISTSFEMMSREGAGSERRYMDRGKRSVDELKLLIQRAADAISIDDMVDDLDLQSVNILDLLQELVSDCQESIKDNRSIQVENRFGSSGYLVYGDYLLLKQMFRNIFDNALRHSHPETVVRVEISASGRVDISDEGDVLPENIDNLFSFGYKGENRKQGLYGWGLYLAKKIATAHGGDILAKNSRGGGAVFSISLPSEKSAASA